MSSAQHFFRQIDHPLTVLQNYTNRGSAETEDRVQREFNLMDIFMSLQSFTNECSMLHDVIQNLQTLYQYAAGQFRNYVPGHTMYFVLIEILMTKMETRKKYSTSLPLSSFKDNIAATPATIWKMVKLRHLHIYNHAIFYLDKVQGFINPSKLDDLQTLSSAWFSCVDDADNILAKTPNLRKLRCEVSKFDGVFPAFNKLTKLEMLKFSSGRTWTWASELNFPSSLKKLTLLDGRLSRSSLDQVATLPRLEALKLLGLTVNNSEVWQVTDEHFPLLKFLKLQSPSFSKWNVSDEAFPNLEHLVLRRCRHLKEIPSRFEDTSSLKSVEIISCNEALAKSAMAIRETLIDISGTTGFDLFIHK